MAIAIMAIRTIDCWRMARYAIEKESKIQGAVLIKRGSGRPFGSGDSKGILPRNYPRSEDFHAQPCSADLRRGRPGFGPGVRRPGGRARQEDHPGGERRIRAD